MYLTKGEKKKRKHSASTQKCALAQGPRHAYHMYAYTNKYVHQHTNTHIHTYIYRHTWKKFIDLFTSIFIIIKISCHVIRPLPLSSIGLYTLAFAVLGPMLKQANEVVVIKLALAIDRRIAEKVVDLIHYRRGGEAMGMWLVWASR